MRWNTPGRVRIEVEDDVSCVAESDEADVCQIDANIKSVDDCDDEVSNDVPVVWIVVVDASRRVETECQINRRITTRRY